MVRVGIVGMARVGMVRVGIEPNDQQYLMFMLVTSNYA